MKFSLQRSLSRLIPVAVLALGLPAAALASPLDSSWTQVGRMNPDGDMFNGNCNLDLSGSCTYSDAGGDYWTGFSNADQILFITGDRQFWGQASYATVSALVGAAAGEFQPNLQWIDAGRNGTSIGAATGSLLMRSGNPEDPWVGLEGGHFASWSEMLWGENAWVWSPLTAHTDLMMAHGGVDVFARAASTQTSNVPEPATMALFGLGLLGLAAKRRRQAK